MMSRVFDRARTSPPARTVLRPLAGVAILIASAGVYFVFAPKLTKIPAPPEIELGRVDRAVARVIDEASATVRASPKSAAAWGKLAMILTAHEMAPEVADFCYGRAAQLNPRDFRWPYYRGIALSTSSAEKAIPELQRAAAMGGDAQSVIRLDLAELLLQHGRLQEAEQELQKTLHLDSSNAPALLTLARTAFQQGDLEIGLKDLDCPAADPRTRKAALTLRAQIHMRTGEKRVAAADARAAARAPADAPWPNPLRQQLLELRAGKRRQLSEADELLAQNRPAEAVTSLRATVRQYPDLGWAWLLLGRALLMRNDLASADETLRTATRLLPDSAEAQFYLGVASYLQKDRAIAASCFRRAAELEPTLADAHFNLANCLAEEGDRAGAIEALRATLRCKPDSAQAHALLGDLLRAEGDPAEAIEHLRTAAELDPGDSASKQQVEKLQRASPQ